MRSTLLILLFALPLAAQKYPTQTGRVNDFAGVLTYDQAAKLTEEIRSFEERTETELVVVTIQSLEGAEVSGYAKGLGNTWGVGKTGNGVVVLVAMKERKIQVQAGKTLKTILPDQWLTETVRDMAVPAFRANRPSDGISGLVRAIVDKVTLVPLEPAPVATEEEKSSIGLWGWVAMVIMAMTAVFLCVFAAWVYIKRHDEQVERERIAERQRVEERKRELKAEERKEKEEKARDLLKTMPNMIAKAEREARTDEDRRAVIAAQNTYAHCQSQASEGIGMLDWILLYALLSESHGHCESVVTRASFSEPNAPIHEMQHRAADSFSSSDESESRRSSDSYDYGSGGGSSFDSGGGGGGFDGGSGGGGSW